MTDTRIYAVRNKVTGQTELVEASHPAIALRHIASSAFEVEAASGKEVAALMVSGAKVEIAGKGSA